MSVPILLYHQIAQVPQKDMPVHGFLVHPTRFRSQMNWSKRAGYPGLSLRDVPPHIKGEKIGKVAASTFDDGFLNVLENAAPVLAEYGFTATKYFVANQIGGSNIWDKPLGVLKTPLMSLSQLREWAALGHEVSVHSLDHVHFTEAPDNEARIDFPIKDDSGDPQREEVTVFCFPYSENSSIHRVMAQEAGFKTATTTVRGRACLEDNLFELPRISIRRREIWPKFLMRISTC